MTDINIVYKYFTACENVKYFNCNVCKKDISRGSGDARKANTTNLQKHLITHPDAYKEFMDKKLDVESSKANKRKATGTVGTGVIKQPRIQDMLQAKEKWSPDSVKAKEFDKFILEMIIMGNHPFTIVNEIGFQRLVHSLQPKAVLKSDKFYRDMLHQTYDSVASIVKETISHAKYFSFTTDVWSNDAKTVSLLSVIGHYADLSSCTRPKVVLSTVPLEDDCTDEYLSEKLETAIVEKWSIPESKIHAVVHDNGAMVKAIETNPFLCSIRCFAHTLQLAINGATESQRVVVDLKAKGREIVGHFKRSEQATRRLKNIQMECNLPQHKLMQDTPTRWNSSYYMLQRLLEQKEAVVLYDARYGLPSSLSGNEWKIVSNVLQLLQLEPIEQATKEISSDESTASVIIPFVQTIKAALLPRPGAEGGVGTMQQPY